MLFQSGEMPERLGVYVNVHLVSDSTGETLAGVLRAVCAQFDNIMPVEHAYFLVRSMRQLERVMGEIEASPGMIIATVSSEEQRSALEAFAHAGKYPLSFALDSPIEIMSEFIGQDVVGGKAGLLERGPSEQAEFAINLRRFIDALDGCVGQDEQNTVGSNKTQLPVPKRDLDELKEAGEKLLAAPTRPATKNALSRFLESLERVLAQLRRVFESVTDQMAHTRDTPFSQYVTSFAKAAGTASGYGAMAAVASLLFNGNDLFTKAAMLLSKFFN